MPTEGSGCRFMTGASAHKHRRSAAFVAEAASWAYRYHTLLRKNTIGASFPDGLIAPLDDELPTESV